MKVLVAVASRHGSTVGIGEVVAGSLRDAGLETDVVRAEDVASLEGYDAVVLGSAVYAGHWLDAARKLVARHAEELARRPVWLFSSGPLGDPPRPQEDPVEAEPSLERIGARGHRLFAGRIDRSELGFAEKAVVALVRAPEGDFRMWPEIAAWGKEIAASLAEGSPASLPVA